MGRFANKVSAATKQRSSIIKVNPYELPEKALAVIANICTKQNKDDASSVIFDRLKSTIYKEYKPSVIFFDLIDDNRHNLSDVDFISSLNSILIDLEVELSAHENTDDTQIVVAGGFSAGKSSFLNTITGAEHLLPTGIEPVSMISTYLYFSNKVNNVIVKGVNLKDAVVLLDEDVLQCIQHSSSSKVYLASVLKKLFVEIPLNKSIDLSGLVFIDTPGYNNSDKANDTNGQADQKTATDSFREGNVLFWVVDIENGTVPAKDRTLINKFLEEHEGEGKVVIIFNKADKKPKDEIKSIVDLAAKEYGLGTDNSIIDVLAYSCIDNRIHYSKKGYTMQQLLKEVKRAAGKGNSGVENCLRQVRRLFDNEIEHAKNIIEEKKKERDEYIISKDKNYKLYVEDKQDCKDYMTTINDIMVDSYDNIIEISGNYAASSANAINRFRNFYDRVDNYERNRWGSSDTLLQAIRSADSAIDRCVDEYNEIVAAEKDELCSYSQEDRKKLSNRIKKKLKDLNDKYKSDYESYDKLCEDKAREIEESESLLRGLKFYRDEINDTLKSAIRVFQYSAHKPQDARLLKADNVDIFTAISSGNHIKFMDCFTHGVSLNTYSNDGFSPLTFAVKEGAVNMVRFFIQNNADITALDNNGYNAFHVAVIYGYRNICELLMNEEPTISNTVTSTGKNALQLLEQQPFDVWLKNKL